MISLLLLLLLTAVSQTERLPWVTHPWIGEITEFDRGYCGPPVSGYGWDGRLAWPVEVVDVNDGRYFRQGHTGIDFNADPGTAVYAAAPGVVVWAGFSKWGGGELVVLAHGRGWQTYYAHLSEVVAECGVFYGRGDLLGYTGQTGMASWPHLHLEVRNGEFSYDPEGFMED